MGDIDSIPVIQPSLEISLMSWKIDETNCLSITTLGCLCASGISSTLWFIPYSVALWATKLSIISYCPQNGTITNPQKRLFKKDTVLVIFMIFQGLLLSSFGFLNCCDGVETLEIKLSKVDSKTLKTNMTIGTSPIFNRKYIFKCQAFHCHGFGFTLEHQPHHYLHHPLLPCRHLWQIRFPWARHDHGKLTKLTDKFREILGSFSYLISSEKIPI